jgi:hypothetical protein
VSEIPRLKPEAIMYGGHKTLLELREKDILLGGRAI